MAKNYTDEQTKHMIAKYQANPTRETVDKLAMEMGKTVKSVIGKLSREKVYVKKDYVTKRGNSNLTVRAKILIRRLIQILSHSLPELLLQQVYRLV